MRFIADGPAIPDDLITAHDEGRVILFCGSGISRARANLPDFMGLAATVLDSIGSAPESRARKVKEAAEQAPKIDGLGALIAADTIFSQLEDEFPLDLIQKHVARALHKPDADLAAHRMLLDLARGPDGRIRLAPLISTGCSRRASPRSRRMWRRISLTLRVPISSRASSIFMAW